MSVLRKLQDVTNPEQSLLAKCNYDSLPPTLQRLVRLIVQPSSPATQHRASQTVSQSACRTSRQSVIHQSISQKVSKPTRHPSGQPDEKLASDSVKPAHQHPASHLVHISTSEATEQPTSEPVNLIHQHATSQPFYHSDNKVT